MRGASWRVALLPLLPLAAGQSSQVVVTIAVPYCPTYSSSLASFSSVLPGYSSEPLGYGSMSAPASPGSSTSSSSPLVVPGTSASTNDNIPSPGTNIVGSSTAPGYGSVSPSSTVSSTPLPSASLYTDRYGETYRLEANTGLSGVTIDSASQRRRRQNGELIGESSVEGCIESCSITPQCQAISHLGSTCILYASVRGSMFLVGGEAAFNLARFTGFANDTGTGTSSGSPSSQSSSTGTTEPSSVSSSVESPVLSISFYSTTVTGVSTNAGVSSVPEGSVSTAYVTPVPSISTSTSLSEGMTIETFSSSVGASVPTYTSATVWSSQSQETEYSSSARASSSLPNSFASSQIQLSTPQASTPSSLYSVDPSSQPAASSALDGSSSTTQSGLSEASATTQYATVSFTGTSTPASWLGSLSQDATSIVVPPASTSAIASVSSAGPQQAGSSTSPVSSSMWLATSSAVSSPMPSSSSPSVYACPANNGSSITDVNGIQYELRCSADTDAVGLGQASAVNSFNDCFNFCDAATTCTGFSYLGANNGAGSGDCYLKQGNIFFTEGDSARVAAIRLTQRSQISTSMAPTFASSSASSSGLSTSSAPSSSGISLVSITSSSSRQGSTTGLSSSSAAIPTSITGTSSSSLPSSSSRQSSSSSKSSTTQLSAASPSPYVSPSSSTSSSVPSPTPVRNNGKRGLAYTNATFTLPYSLSGQNSRVSWGYNWFYSRYTDSQLTSNPAIQFIPVLFSDAADLMQVWAQKAQEAIDAGADALMSFNEPDLCYPGSACMSVNQSVTAYKTAMQPFAGKIRLGAPAVTDGGYPSGLGYLQDFMGNCTGCTFDFINIHWYNNVYAFSYLQYYVQHVYELFGLPIWITEFGIDGSGGTEAQYQAFLQQALPWLDAVPYVERYAWFLDAPGYLINANGSGLSAQGMIYNSYTAPCANWTNTAGHC